MKTLACVLFFIYFLNANFSSVSGLRCYFCSGITGYKSDCEVKVNTKTIPSIYCGAGHTACMTLVINNTISRSCSVSNVCQIYSNSTGFRSCTTCVTDLCNGSTVTSFSWPLGLFVAVLTAAKLIVY